MSFFIVTNRYHVIVDCDKNAMVHLRCASVDDLVGKPITTIMSKVIGCMHTSVFFENISKSTLKDIIVRLETRHMSMATRYVVYTVDRLPLMCNMSVVVQLDSDYTISGYIVNVRVEQESYGLQDTVPYRYKRFIGSDNTCLSRCDSVTCVIMDLCNSTRFVNTHDHTGRRIAEVLAGVYNLVKREIMSMYPFMYVHELIGDSVFIVMNASFFVNHSRFLHDACLHTLCRIQVLLDNYLRPTGMWMRIGVATGPVHAGVIDGRTFRLFGLTVHRAQRLESVCPRGKIAFDKCFKDHLRHSPPESIHEADLKGIGKTTYYTTSGRANG